MQLHIDAKVQTIKVFNNIESRCLAKHNNKYSYEHFVYLTQHTPSYITCPKHGDFLQTIANHLNGKGCSKCSRENFGKSQTLNNDTFSNRSNNIHNRFYDYSNVSYKNYYTPVIIGCPIHGSFLQKPSDHLAGSGCQICGEITKRKKYLNKPTTLYYIKITTANHVLYKVGITTKTVRERYYTESNTGCIIETIWEEVFSTGRPAYEEEQRLLNKYKNYKYNGPDIFIKGGNSEIFTEDVLGHDKIK